MTVLINYVTLNLVSLRPYKYVFIIIIIIIILTKYQHLNDKFVLKIVLPLSLFFIKISLPYVLKTNH